LNANRKRAVSPVLFLLVFVLFTMPFFSVSCQGRQLKAFSGYEIASGNTKIDTASLGLGSGESTTPQQGNVGDQVAMILVLVLAAAGVALPFIPIKLKDTLLISTIVGAAGAVILIGFAMMAPGQVASQTQNLAEGKAEMGLWLALLAMAGAGGFSFYLRSAGVDASAPLDIGQVFSGTPGAAPHVAAAPYPGVPGTPPAGPPVGGRACPHCGSLVAARDTFCQKCGSAIGGAETGSPSGTDQP
jgi:hypothetical protein